MLTYHPAFDSYHCFLRVLTFLVNAEHKEYEIDSVRIFDYYFCAPSSIKTFKFPRDLIKARKTFSDKVNHYNDVPNQRALFMDLKSIQDAVFDQMMSMGLIDGGLFRAGKIKLVNKNIPLELMSVIDSEESIDDDIKSFVINNLVEIPLLGANGLKHRSGLMDYRYDLV